MGLRARISVIRVTLKDCLPHLYHGFKNKYFNKISLDNILYFPKYLYKLKENTWVFDKFALKSNLQNKM